MNTEGSDSPQQLAVRESGYRQGTRAVVPEGKGQKIKIRLMGWEPGSTVVEGSSADYPVDVIVRDFPATFPKGTRMRANHDGVCDPGGDIKRIMAKTTSDPWEEADGMYADAIVREGEPTEFVREYADVIGTSISAAADLKMEVLRDPKGSPVLDENDEPVMVPAKSERGAHIVDRFLPMTESPYNAIDFVEVPGADGAIVALAVESAKQLINKTMLREASTFAIDLAGKREKTSPGVAEGAQPGPNPAPGSSTKEDSMNEETALRLIAAVEGFSTKLDSLVTEDATRRAAAEDAGNAAPTDLAEAVDKGVEAVLAVKAANLTPKLEAALIADAKAGKDVTAGIAEAQAILAEAREAQAPARPETIHAGESAGAGGVKKAHNYGIGRFLGGN